MSEFISVDDKIQTSADVTDESIIEEVQARRNQAVSENIDNNDEEEEQIPTHTTQDLMNAVKTLSNHFWVTDNCCEFFKISVFNLQ